MKKASHSKSLTFALSMGATTLEKASAESTIEPTPKAQIWFC